MHLKVINTLFTLLIKILVIMQTIKTNTNSKSIKDLLTNAINESVAMDNFKESDLVLCKGETFSNDESEDLVTTIEIPDIYPSDTVEHIEKNSENFSRIIGDFIFFLIGETHASYPLLILSEDEQETLLINLSDNYLHIYYHNNGQY